MQCGEAILDLLQCDPPFSFFMEEVYQGDTAAASLADEASSSVFVSELEEETGALELTAPDELTEEEEEAVLAGLQGLKRGSRRYRVCCKAKHFRMSGRDRYCSGCDKVIDYS